MSADLTQRDALMRLGASTAEAIAQVLEMFAPGAVERGEVSVLAEGSSPFSGVTRGSVAASVSYVDGVSGANIFVLTSAGVRKLAQAMGMPAGDGDDAELSDLELSAVGEASNQMMAAAASAIGVVLGQEIAISPPDIRVLDNPDTAAETYGTSPHATSTTFLIGGESCRLVQLVPNAFVVRMARALDDLSAEQAGADDDVSRGDRERAGKAETVALVEALSEIKLRVWAELGRADLALGRALGLPLGSVVELDQPADAPVELFVNGLRFAQGHLIVTDDGEWAFQCDAVGGKSAADLALAARTAAEATVEGETAAEVTVAEETDAEVTVADDADAAETAPDETGTDPADPAETGTDAAAAEETTPNPPTTPPLEEEGALT